MNSMRNAAVLAAILSVAVFGPANALVVVSSSAGAPDGGPSAGETKVITFDSGLPGGVTLFGDGAIVSGSVAGQYATPALDTTPYLTTPFSTGSGASELDFASFLGNHNVSRFSFYWGSIDTYNTLQLLDRSGTGFFAIAGSTIPPANGDQMASSTNRRVSFTLTGADQNLGGLLFTSTSKAFETDTFSFATVPEPGSWSMMLLGFGGLGGLLRQRRRKTAIAAA